MVYSPLCCSKRELLSCFLGAQKVNFQRIDACLFPYNEIWHRILSYGRRLETKAIWITFMILDMHNIKILADTDKSTNILNNMGSQ